MKGVAWRVFALLALGLVGASFACFRPSGMVASRFVKSVYVEKQRGAVITVTREESPELAGTMLSIPPDALDQNETITIELGLDSIVGAPASQAGPVAIFGPPGLEFRRASRLGLPYSQGAERNGATLFVQVLESEGTRFRITREQLEVTTEALSFDVLGFTAFQPGTSVASQPPPDAGPDAGGCAVDADCPPGEECQNGACLEVDAGTMDAGVDAGTDAGADAGSGDAGTDGGRPCDPRFQNCPSGEYCYFDATAPSPSAYCSVNTDVRDWRETCSSPTACFTTNPTDKGLHCHGLGTPDGGVCFHYCDTTTGNQSCVQVPRPQICVPVVGAPAGIGYCEPV